MVCDREEALKPMVQDNDGGASGTGQSGAGAMAAIALAAAASSSSLPLPSSLLAQGIAGGGAHTPDTQSHLSPALALLASTQGQGLPSSHPSPPRPEPLNGSVPLDGEVFGQVLELWGFLCTFATPLKIVAIPSLNHFANALKACDPAYRHLHQHARGALHTFEAVSAHAATTGDY